MNIFYLTALRVQHYISTFYKSFSYSNFLFTVIHTVGCWGFCLVLGILRSFKLLWVLHLYVRYVQFRSRWQFSKLQDWNKLSLATLELLWFSISQLIALHICNWTSVICRSVTSSSQYRSKTLVGNFPNCKL